LRAVTVSAYRAAPAVAELPDPQPGCGQILIKVGAAGINLMDRSIAAGYWQSMMPATFPPILAADVAGVVDTAGRDNSFLAGRRSVRPARSPAVGLPGGRQRAPVTP
jgi:NADPH:quinone reductase-like Zn-dependent oxidoreductase